MGCTFFSVKFGNAFLYFVVSDGAIIQYKYLKELQDQTVLKFMAGMEIIFLYKKVSIYKVHSTISMNRTFLDCKHKHMMKSGAPTDKVGVLYHLLPIDFHSFTSRIDF